MKVNSSNNNIPFQSFYKNKFLHKSLEFAADNGTLFAATTTLILSAGIRPLSILLTPKTDRENKKIACKKSLISTLINYGIVLGVTLPMSKAFKNINKNPEKYLKKETVQNLKEAGKELTDSKAYSFATQLFKLGAGLFVAAPKSIIAGKVLPLTIENQEQKENKEKEEKNSQIPFKGKDKLSSFFGNILNKEWYQNFSKKFKDTNFPMHIIALTDVISTGAFIKTIDKDNKMQEENKKVLEINSVLSTGLSILFGYTADKLTDKPAKKFWNKFKEENINNPNLGKYKEGLKIAKPVLIFGIIYYTFIPVISTFFAERINKKYSKDT
jgi:hypothetical protein